MGPQIKITTKILANDLAGIPKFRVRTHVITTKTMVAATATPEKKETRPVGSDARVTWEKKSNGVIKGSRFIVILHNAMHSRNFCGAFFAHKMSAGNAQKMWGESLLLMHIVKNIQEEKWLKNILDTDSGFNSIMD